MSAVTFRPVDPQIFSPAEKYSLIKKIEFFERVQKLWNQVPELIKKQASSSIKELVQKVEERTRLSTPSPGLGLLIEFKTEIQEGGVRKALFEKIEKLPKETQGQYAKDAKRELEVATRMMVENVAPLLKEASLSDMEAFLDELIKNREAVDLEGFNCACSHWREYTEVDSTEDDAFVRAELLGNIKAYLKERESVTTTTLIRFTAAKNEKTEQIGKALLKALDTYKEVFQLDKSGKDILTNCRAWYSNGKLEKLLSKARTALENIQAVTG